MGISNLLKADLSRVMAESQSQVSGSAPGSEAHVRDTAALHQRTLQLAQALKDTRPSVARASASLRVSHGSSSAGGGGGGGGVQALRRLDGEVRGMTEQSGLLTTQLHRLSVARQKQQLERDLKQAEGTPLHVHEHFSASASGDAAVDVDAAPDAVTTIHSHTHLSPNKRTIINIHTTTPAPDMAVEGTRAREAARYAPPPTSLSCFVTLG
jgi:hypothetical protein